MSLVHVEQLRDIAEVEFVDIVVEAFIPDLNELRIILADGSFVDVWFSLKLQGRYSFHWERRAIDGTIYRHDTTRHTGVGNRWRPSPGIFTMVVRPTFRKVISARFLKLLCGNSWRLCGPPWIPQPAVRNEHACPWWRFAH